MDSIERFYEEVRTVQNQLVEGGLTPLETGPRAEQIVKVRRRVRGNDVAKNFPDDVRRALGL